MGTSESGFYTWRTRPPSARSIRHVILSNAIRQIHAASKGIYGSRSVHAELVLGRGIQVWHGTVSMLMARDGLSGVASRPKWHRPRTTLSWRTPAEALDEHLRSLQQAGVATTG